MRICMLVANPITFDGRVIRHAQTLVEAGHEVTVLGVIGPNDSLIPDPQDWAFATWRLDRRRRGVLPRLIWGTTALRQRAALRLSEWLSEAWLSRIGVIAEFAVATSAIELMVKAASMKCDVYHGNDLNTLPAVAWAGRVRGRPYLYDAHELYVDETPDLSPGQRRARQVAEARHIRGAAVVMTVNELIATELAQQYGIRQPVIVRNVPPLCNAPDPLTQPPGRPGSLRLLYHAANVGLNQHGTDDVLRAMSRVQDGSPQHSALSDRLDVHLTIRGRISREDEALLFRRVEELGLAGRVKLCPPVSGAVELIEAAIAGEDEVGLAVHPSLCRNYDFVTSSKIYEYQIAGLAVCATDVIGNHLTLDEQAGMFYPYGDDQRLAEIFLLLGHDRKKLRTMRHVAWKQGLEKLNWECDRPRLLGIYDDLAKRASRGS